MKLTVAFIAMALVAANAAVVDSRATGRAASGLGRRSTAPARNPPLASFVKRHSDVDQQTQVVNDGAGNLYGQEGQTSDDNGDHTKGYGSTWSYNKGDSSSQEHGSGSSSHYTSESSTTDDGSGSGLYGNEGYKQGDLGANQYPTGGAGGYSGAGGYGGYNGGYNAGYGNSDDEDSKGSEWTDKGGKGSSGWPYGQDSVDGHGDQTSGGYGDQTSGGYGGGYSSQQGSEQGSGIYGQGQVGDYPSQQDGEYGQGDNGAGGQYQSPYQADNWSNSQGAVSDAVDCKSKSCIILTGGQKDKAHVDNCDERDSQNKKFSFKPDSNGKLRYKKATFQFTFTPEGSSVECVDNGSNGSSGNDAQTGMPSTDDQADDCNEDLGPDEDLSCYSASQPDQVLSWKDFIDQSTNGASSSNKISVTKPNADWKCHVGKKKKDGQGNGHDQDKPEDCDEDQLPGLNQGSPYDWKNGSEQGQPQDQGLPQSWGQGQPGDDKYGSEQGQPGDDWKNGSEQGQPGDDWKNGSEQGQPQDQGLPQSWDQGQGQQKPQGEDQPAYNPSFPGVGPETTEQGQPWDKNANPTPGETTSPYNPSSIGGDDKDGDKPKDDDKDGEHKSPYDPSSLDSGKDKTDALLYGQVKDGEESKNGEDAKDGEDSKNGEDGKDAKEGEESKEGENSTTTNDDTKTGETLDTTGKGKQQDWLKK